jgi:hypothetical protein
MARVRVIHQKAAEAAPLLAELKLAGNRVEYDESFAAYWRNRGEPPDAFVIDLTRAPSHGREIAIFLRRHKTTRHVPTIFVDGEPQKVDVVQRLLPDAIYTSRAKLLSAIKRAKPVANPVAPPGVMERYSGRSVAQKLGITANSRVGLVDPPADFERVIGPVPEGTSFEEGTSDGCKITLWFLHDYAAFQAALPQMRRLVARSRLWLLWRKGKRDGLDGNIIRQGANQVGLVDYKICSPNATWSAMVFAIAKARIPKGSS